MEKKESAIHKIGRQALILLSATKSMVGRRTLSWAFISRTALKRIRTLRSHRRRIISDSSYLPSRFTYYPRHIKQL